MREPLIHKDHIPALQRAVKEQSGYTKRLKARLEKANREKELYSVRIDCFWEKEDEAWINFIDGFMHGIIRGIEVSRDAIREMRTGE